ncbi:MAG TPA: clostripain-related cysteine peptidase [Polyangiales bacterium]|nr:clostripain-related cysteine peptidase [Polyangiales bacterium]
MVSRKWFDGLVLIAALATLACDSSDDDGQPSQPTQESWLIGIYMAADNNLDAAATSDINEILAGGVPENTTVLMLVDRAKLGEYGSFGEVEGLEPHSTAKWLRITSAGLKELEDLGEIDTASPATVRMFLERLRKEPAERRAVIFWDHGSSFSFGSDDSARDPSSSMSAADIAAQFRVDPRDAKSDYARFDLIGFDACLMSSLEALAEFQPVAPLYVGSAELEPGDGWNYDAIFKFMGRTPDLTPRELATTIVNSYADYYGDKPSRASGLQVTQAVWSTDSAEVKRSLDALVKAYEQESDSKAGNYNVVADLYSAQAESTFYARSTEDPSEQTSWMDVGEFLANHSRTGGPDVAKAADALRGSLEKLRIAHRTDGRADDVMGLSIYFPINRVGNNTGATDNSSRSVAKDARLLDGSYAGLLKLVDAQDGKSLVGLLAADDAVPPTVAFQITNVSDSELTLDVKASDDVMLVSGQAVLVYETNDGGDLAVVSVSPGDIGVKDYDVTGALPRTAVLIGPDGVTPSSNSVGFLKRVQGSSSVPVAVKRGSRQERGLLLLADDHAIDGLTVQSENGTWAAFAWSDVVAAPGVEIAPLHYTVDTSKGSYTANTGSFTKASDVAAHFVPLEDKARLSVTVAATDIAGKTTLSSAELP